MSLLDPEELEALLPAESASFPSPIPTQFVPSDEFPPSAQTDNQRKVEARIKELGSRLAKHQGYRGANSSRPQPAWRQRSSR